jgi:hypothetical protein
VNDFVLSITETSSGYSVRTDIGVTLSIPPFSHSKLSPEQEGRYLYQKIFTGPVLAAYHERVPECLCIRLPAKLLHWSWRWLHDGFQFLALRHPLLLLPDHSETLAPSIIKYTPINILITTINSSKTSKSEVENEEKIIRSLKDMYPGQVKVRRESHVNKRRLIEVLTDATQRFHLWHHSGPCSSELELQLADTTLSQEQFLTLVNQHTSLQCLVLNTHNDITVNSIFSKLNVPFTIYFTSGDTPLKTLSLIKGFYHRLFKYELVVAALLSQLDSYLTDMQSRDWLSVGMFARTPHLFFHLSKKKVLDETTPVKTRILFLKGASSPSQVKRASLQVNDILRIDREIREIQQAMLESRHYFTYAVGDATRPRDISGHLLRHIPHILHFSGHGGRTSNHLFFTFEKEDYSLDWAERDDGSPDPVQLEPFVEMLANCRETLRCVVLNACYTLPLAEAITSHIDCVVGMSNAISDDAAIHFSRGFYQALAYGKSIKQAFSWACSEIGVASQKADERYTPQLKCRSGVNPDTVVFHTRAGEK